MRVCTGFSSDNTVGLRKAEAIDAIIATDDAHADVLLRGILVAVKDEKKRLHNKRKREIESQLLAKKQRVLDALVEQRQRELDAFHLPFDVSVNEQGFTVYFNDAATESDSHAAEATERVCESISEKFAEHDGDLHYADFLADITEDNFATEVATMIRSIDADDAKLCLVPTPSTRKRTHVE